MCDQSWKTQGSIVKYGTGRLLPGYKQAIHGAGLQQDGCGQKATQ